MSEDVRLLAALAAWIVVMVICQIHHFRHGKSRKQKFIEAAKAQGNYTTATLADSKIRLGDDESNNSYYKNDRAINVYEYVLNGVKYKKKMVFQSPGMVSVRYPYTVVVYYDAKKPARGVCQEEAGKGSGCLVTIVLAMLAFMCVYHVLKLF